jgi:hypothetical protein
MSAVLERVSSQAWVPAWIRHQHIARYQWASEHSQSSRHRSGVRHRLRRRDFKRWRRRIG